MKSLSSSDFDRFLSEISSLSRAGVPLPEGMSKFSESVDNGALADLSGEVAGYLNKGDKLSDAFDKCGYQVPDDFVAMIQCAEISGDLRSGLSFLVHHFRQIKRHRSALITTLFYPFLIIVVGLIIFWFASTYIIPGCMETFERNRTDYSFITRVSLSISGYIQGKNGVILFVLLGVLGMVTMLSPSFRRLFWRLMMLLPGFSGLAAFSDTAITMKFLGEMLKFGVPIQTALRAVSLSVMTPSMQEHLKVMADTAERGQCVSNLMGPRTPATAAWLFARAEEHGNLPDTCLGIAEYCNERFDLMSKRLVTVIEPIVIILVSLLIGVTIISLYLPLFSLPKMVG